MKLWILAVSFWTVTGHAKPAWTGNMQELGKTLSQMIPELAESRPVTPATKRTLERGTRKLSRLVHIVGKTTSPPEADPTLAMVARLFERDLADAEAALKAGRVESARTELRQIAGYCIACHSRLDAGPSFPTLSLTPELESLTRLQRGELLAAIRQFDAALVEFEAIAGDALFAKRQPLEWSRAVRHGVMIAVRVKKSPDRAAKLVDLVSAVPARSGFSADVIPAWKKSLAEWKAEPPRTVNTEEGLYLEAVRLAEAGRALQKNPLDHVGDVYFLRSTATVHELLNRYPTGARAAEALLLAGTAYDLLDDRFLSPLSDMYYEACIRRAPHTDISARCYSHYETNVLFGYARATGAQVTDEMEKRMLELRDLAEKAEK